MFKKLEGMTIKQLAARIDYSVVGTRKMVKKMKLGGWTVPDNKAMIIIRDADVLKVIEKIKAKQQ